MDLKYTKEYNRELSLTEKFYIREITLGVATTLKHFFNNWPLRHKQTQTKFYPEERMYVTNRVRGRHYLTKRSDGRLTCVACQMCAIACPTNVIHIEVEKLDEPYYTGRQKIDRRPKTFTIDQLTCIYCGMCVEACPEDAIRMDGGHVALAVVEREEGVVRRDLLLEFNQGPHEVRPMDGPNDDKAVAPLEIRPANEVQQREM